MSLLEPPIAEAGIEWDALRIPDPYGRDLLEELAATDQDRAQLGPVVWSEWSRCTYWLITTGTTAEAWPTWCRLLTRGSSLTLPGNRICGYAAEWLFRPSGPRLTGPTWLSAALDTVRRAA